MAAMQDLVEEVERSFAETQERLSDPSVYNDHREAAGVGRRLKELEAAHKLATEWLEASSDLEAARDDGDLRELVPELEERVAQLEDELKLALVETDPADRKDVIVEMRQAAGGDEAALWAGDVFRMMTRYAERRGFKWEQLEASPNPTGGFQSISFAVKGDDLKIDVYRSTGPGGQSVNTTDSAVRITHLPTGTVVAMQDEKSQLQNKTKALRVLRARLYELEREKQAAEQAATRRSQIGSGGRAEKIRTYNYPENRVTDHRVKLTVHNLDRVLEGELDEFTEALQAEERRQALETAAV